MNRTMSAKLLRAAGAAVVLCGMAAGARPAAGQVCCLAGDVNVDLLIDGDDAGPFVDVLLDPGAGSARSRCAADANRDGSVNGDDVAAFVAIVIDPSLSLFDYGPPRADAEAEQIGLEMLGAGGPLLAPDAIYERIDADLDAIRAFEPRLAGEAHSPAWIPNEMIVAVFQGMSRDDYRCRNAYYGVVNETLLFSSGGVDYYVVTLGGNLNVPALATIYDAAAEVNFAEPNALIGGDNRWAGMDIGGGKWHWDVDDGFWDCFDGCDCHRLYEFRTTATGAVTLLSYQEAGQPWCEF